MFYHWLLPAIGYQTVLLIVGAVLFKRRLETKDHPWRIAGSVLALQTLPPIVLLAVFFTSEPLVIFSLTIVAAISTAAIALFFAVSTLIYATST